MLGAAVATIVGAIDDFRGLRWWEKLGGQIAAAAIPTGFGIWVDRFTFPVLGLDGLAAGVCGIAGATFSVIALSLARPNAAVFSAVVFGACLGFLRHNFYPARIFMGDSGALLLGFVLAAVSVQGLLKTAAVAALFFPLLVLAVPILDTSFVVARRLKHGLPVYAADRQHLHHRFVNIGFSQRRAAAYIYVWVATLAAAALATRFLPFRAHGVWHLGPTLAAGLIGLAAIAASLYMV